MYRLIVFICLCLGMFPHVTLAQLSADFGSVGQTLTVNMNPAHPAPGEQVTATLDDYALGVSFSTISWFVNGQEEAALRNQRSIAFIPRELGQTTTVTARITLPGGASLETSGQITPYFTDIIVEPQTYTPQFYAGRALPTVGSLVRATALVTADSGTINTQSHSYVWKLNGTTLGGGARNGAFQTSYTVPYGNNHTLSVEVYDARGALITRRGVNVETADVIPVLYEVNALYGLSYRALGVTTPFIANTLTLRAIPYNLDLRSTPRNTFTEWRVSGRPIPNESSDPYEVTLERTGFGQSAVSFKVRHREALLQGGEISTRLDF